MSVAASPDVQCAPAYMWVPEGSTFDSGAEAIDLAQQLGFDVDQPERDVLNVLLAESPSGGWAGLETAVVCPRQNLKTWALEISVLLDLYLRDVKRVTWSAHQYRTTRDAFSDLTSIIENHDWLRKRVRQRREANGEEGFEFTNGARLDFLCRSSKGGRGLKGDTVVLDEWMFGTASMLGALIPTLSAVQKPHVRFGSSPGVLESHALRELRERGRSMSDPSLAYIEWTSEQGECEDPDCKHGVRALGCQLDDEEKWAQANPALDRRITRSYVRNERKALAVDPVEFMRERMGWWQDPAGDGTTTVYPLDEWNACLDIDSTVPAGAPVAWSVDVSWDRTMAYVSVAARREDGLIHVQTVHSCDPVAVVEYLADRLPRFTSVGLALQGTGSPVSSLLEDITKAADGICDVIPMNGSDVSKACGVMFDAVKSERIRHVDDFGLDRSVLLASSRPLGDGWALDRKRSPVDIANLVSLTNALYVLMTAPEDPGDPGVWFL